MSTIDLGMQQSTFLTYDLVPVPDLDICQFCSYSNIPAVNFNMRL